MPIGAQTMREKCDPHVGRPFVIAPGNPPEDRVAYDFADGSKLRFGQMMQTWNDALLTDAIEGEGLFLKHAGPSEKRALWVAEMVYGLTFAEMFQAWLKIPKFTRPCVWVQGAKEFSCQ